MLEAVIGSLLILVTSEYHKLFAFVFIVIDYGTYLSMVKPNRHVPVS